MSGTTGATFPFPLTLTNHPQEGSKAVSLNIGWSSGAANPFSINLLSQFNSGQFTSVQAIWVDNSSVPFPLVIFTEQQQQNIIVPAYTQAMYPLVVGQAPVFTISQITNTIGGNSSPPLGTTGLIFFNTPQPPWEHPQPKPLSIAQFSYNTASGFNTSTWTLLKPPSLNLTTYFSVTSVQLTIVGNAGVTVAGGYVVYLGDFGVPGQNTPFFTDFMQLTAGQTGVLYRSGLANYFNPPLLSQNTGIGVFCQAPVAGANLFAYASFTLNLLVIE